MRFFDWDSWWTGVGSSDLAYMMAIHWYPDRRARLERLMLDRYHAALASHGVDSYDRHALDEDYRLSVLWQITTLAAGGTRHSASDLVEQSRTRVDGC